MGRLSDHTRPRHESRLVYSRHWFVALDISFRGSSAESCLVMVAVAGVGHHLQAVLMSNPHQIVAWAKCIYALDLIYFAAVALPKLSILNLCLRVFAVSDAARRITHVMMALMVVIWLSYSLASVFECYPFAYRWDRSIPGGHCFDIVLFYRMVNVSNIVTDIAILILPMPYIWKLHATRSRRGGVTICFLAGSVYVCSWKRLFLPGD